MTSEIEIYSKDSIKLNILQEVINGTAKLSFQLNGGASDDYATQIHKERSRVQVYGKFNISEDPNGEVLTIRPVMIENTLKVSFQLSAPLSGRTISVVRSATKAVEQEYEISRDISSLEFVPQGKQKYIMNLVCADGATVVPHNPSPAPKETPKPAPKPEVQESNQFIEAEIPSNAAVEDNDRFRGFSLDSVSDYGVQDDRFASFDVENDAIVSSTSKADQVTPPEDEIEHRNSIQAESVNEPIVTEVIADSELQRIEQEIVVVERKHGQLSQKKQSAIDHLEKIEAEYKKDYESLEKDLEDIKSRMEADASIIEHYKGQDVMPIEIIIQEIKLKLEEAETQIRFFIEAKQKKTMEIENEIKSNKKQ